MKTPGAVVPPLAGRWAALILAAAVALFGNQPACAGEPTTPATPNKTPDYAPAIERLQRVAADVLAEGFVPGVSIALVDDQKTISSRGFGWANARRKTPATGQTVYRAGSISKLFTALAAAQLAEQGKLDLDGPVSQYDPNFRIVNPFADAVPVTLRQLMCHRSGMVRESPVGGYFDASGPTLAATVGSIVPCVLVHPPNTRTRYSNVGPSIVGHVVGQLSGVPFEAYQQAHLLRPMGMTSSGFVLSDAMRSRLAVARMDVADGRGGFRTIEAPHFELGTLPAGNLYTTAGDLARFLSVLLAEGASQGKAIVKPATLREMLTVQLSSEKAGFGLGFHVDRFRGHRSIGHTGAVYGFTSSVRFLPDVKLGVVVLSSADLALGPVRRLSETALSLLLEAKLGTPLPQEKTAPMPAEPAACAGEYESEGYWARIEAEGGSLRGSISGAAIRLVPTGPDEFLAHGPQLHREPVAFHREAGRVVAFSTLGQRFRRVDAAAVPKPPGDWHKLLGSYGPDFIPLVVTLRHGHLYAMTENMADYRLVPVNRAVFRFPVGLYEDEHLVFQLGPDGRVHGVILANMELARSPGAKSH